MEKQRLVNALNDLFDVGDTLGTYYNLAKRLDNPREAYEFQEALKKLRRVKDIVNEIYNDEKVLHD